MIIDTDQCLNIEEAAKILGCSRESLTYFSRKDIIPDPILFKGRKYYKRETILAWKEVYNSIYKRRKKHRA